MSRPARPSFRPRLVTLEARDNPADLFAESFDQLKPPSTPTGWQAWASDTTYPYITSGLAASSGKTSLASLGGLNTASRFWKATLVSADAGAAASVKTGGPAPLAVVARGQNLNTAKPSYLAAVVQPAGVIDLIEVKAGVVTSLGSVAAPLGSARPWLRVTLQPTGGTAAVQVQRLDTGAYLSAGKWQATPAAALDKAVTWNPAQGVIGVGRGTGGQGMAYVDDVTATAPPGVQETFDGTAPGGLPAGWQRWQNDDAAGFRVTASNGKALSGANGLSSDGRSPSRSRAWAATALPADAQASAAVFTDTVIPASLFIRGSNLATAAPTYYAVTVTRGLNVQLSKVVNGVETPLGSVKSAGYFSYQWVKLTLTAEGGQVRALVYRTDTKQWLGSDGAWQNFPDAAVEAADGSIPGGGFAGVARAASVAGSVSFDDFTAQPAGAANAPRVTVTASQPVGNVTGDVTFAAATTGAATRVEFRLDGVLKSAAAAGAGSWTADTTLLSNGSHSLVVRAIDGSGNVGTATLAFAVNNPAPTPPPARPELAAHHDWVRVAQLAYFGTPLDAFTLDKLRNDVDLVVANPAYLQTIDQTTPGTPQIVYSNVSNLYEGLLTDWLDYADRTGASRELAFYHVSAATAWSGQSPSAKPVREFWAVNRAPAAGGAGTDLTAAARGGRATGVAFGAVGEAVAFGFTDRFRELNFDLSRVAGPSWRGVLEYASKVGPDGTVTEWKQVGTFTDGTGALTRSGRITFDPPADWVAGATGGGGRLFYVRIRTTAGAADPPEAKTVFGRDYAGANGGQTGVIPAFDSAADKDGDGYLTDAEYAGRRAGFDARFVYESRLFYPNYGQMRYAVNPAASAVRRWAAGFHVRQLAALPLADGVFLDNSNGKLPIAGIGVIEPTLNYTDDAANLVLAVAKAVAPRLVFLNTVGSNAEANGLAGNATGAVEEFLLRPMEVNWSGVLDAANLVRGRLAASSPSPYLVLDTYPGGGSVADPRTKLGALAYYYLLADPDRTMVMFFGGFSTSAAWSQTWIGAVSVDVGDPTAGMKVFATGADPQNPALQYQVFGREYENALVLYKPRSYALGAGSGTLADATATTHQLGGTYQVVNADGSLGAVVTQVTLRNGEGAILKKVV